MQGKGPLSQDWIRKLRGSLSQEVFAVRLGGTVTKAMVSKWENGENEPSAPNCLRLLAYAKLLRNADDDSTDRVRSPSMTALEATLLEQFRALPDEMAKLRALTAVIKEVQLSQPGPARESKA